MTSARDYRSIIQAARDMISLLADLMAAECPDTSPGKLTETWRELHDLMRLAEIAEAHAQRYQDRAAEFEAATDPIALVTGPLCAEGLYPAVPTPMWVPYPWEDGPSEDNFYGNRPWLGDPF